VSKSTVATEKAKLNMIISTKKIKVLNLKCSSYKKNQNCELMDEIPFKSKPSIHLGCSPVANNAFSNAAF
jgi:hypothetical protein